MEEALGQGGGETVVAKDGVYGGKRVADPNQIGKAHQ
jgi:hypothetical protein